MIPTALGPLSVDVSASRQAPRGPYLVVPDFSTTLVLPVIALEWLDSPQCLRGPVAATGGGGASAAKLVSSGIPTKRSQKG